MHTIIDDGQFRFPVGSSDLTQWVAANGQLTLENYEQFCSEVQSAVRPGTPECVRYCARLERDGAEVVRL